MGPSYYYKLILWYDKTFTRNNVKKEVYKLVTASAFTSEHLKHIACNLEAYDPALVAANSSNLHMVMRQVCENIRVKEE